MKMGVCSAVYGDLPLVDALEKFRALNIKNIEIFSGGEGITPHMNVFELLESESKRTVYKDLLKRYNIELGSLNATGNPVHPVGEIREKAHNGFVNTLKLAEKMGVDTVVVFSGTPGGSPKDETPNWITCPWPDEYSAMLEYQWNEVLIPYWENAVSIAREYGIKKIAFEMHPGFCVYNPETLLKLRSAVGNEIGSNFDPSHIMWQGVDPTLAIKELRECIFSVHAKDVYVNRDYILRNGVNDAKHYENFLSRAWTFRTVGYGHDYSTWKDIISTLAMVGYDGAINIEHEDGIFSRAEGLAKASKFISGILRNEPAEAMWWA